MEEFTIVDEYGYGEWSVCLKCGGWGCQDGAQDGCNDNIAHVPEVVDVSDYKVVSDPETEEEGP